MTELIFYWHLTWLTSRVAREDGKETSDSTRASLFLRQTSRSNDQNTRSQGHLKIISSKIQWLYSFWPMRKCSKDFDLQSLKTFSNWVCLKMWLVPLKPMVLLIIIPMKNCYFIGNIPYFQTNPIVLRSLLRSSDPPHYVNGNSRPYELWWYSRKHRPYFNIGLIYGKYLHFRILKFPLVMSSTYFNADLCSECPLTTGRPWLWPRAAEIFWAKDRNFAYPLVMSK